MKLINTAKYSGMVTHSIFFEEKYEMKVKNRIEFVIGRRSTIANPLLFSRLENDIRFIVLGHSDLEP